MTSKHCIKELRETIVQQNAKIDLLESKVALKVYTAHLIVLLKNEFISLEIIFFSISFYLENNEK